MQTLAGISPEESIIKWSEEDQAVLVAAFTPWHAEVYRVDVGTGEGALLEKADRFACRILPCNPLSGTRYCRTLKAWWPQRLGLPPSKSIS
jgi:hypothetical protein